MDNHNYKEFYSFLQKNNLISPIWKYILELIEKHITNYKKDDLLIIFSIYFSLIMDGNICISLNCEKLKEKWKTKIDDSKILLSEEKNYDEKTFDEYYELGIKSINNSINNINENNFPELIGDNKLFKINSGWLYLQKYYLSKEGVSEKLKTIFPEGKTEESNFDYRKLVNFSLSNGQEQVIKKGKNKNLIITGGPGTGKTTSIVFLLISLLIDNPSQYKIYLTAPSGKAKKRMKQSIMSQLYGINDEFKKNNIKVIKAIEELKPSTIHSLLGIDFDTNRFKYNKNNQFEKNSMFIIDEASMIDVCLFNSLLEAIPETARVFIMGDKDQLPSVECGAVFGDLLENDYLINNENIVKLDVSKRFGENTAIYKLAKNVNEGLGLPVAPKDWQNYKDFKVTLMDDKDKTTPIYYYNIEEDNPKDIIEYTVGEWAKQFYRELQKESVELDPNDFSKIDKLYKFSENSRILCAENKGPRGIQTINKFVKKHFIDHKQQTSIEGYYPGMLMMINKNNKKLELSNGDSGILVKFKADETLYFMTENTSEVITEDGKKTDEIFKLKGYMFYPLRLIARNEIDLAYAITIHKSQGSDYRYIYVILPDKIGHPLLNRQIVYTAITRTRGATYILSNQRFLEKAKDRVITRDTNVK